MNKKKALDGAASWTLATIKFTYNYYDIFATGIYSKNGLDKDLNDYCSNAHLQYKKYILLYTCYFFGALYAQCKIHKIKFQMNEKFLINQLNNFFRLAKKFYKNPKNNVQYLDFMDTIPLNKKVNLNKNIYLAHIPNLKKKYLIKIVKWFLKNFSANYAIEKVFYGAEHYFCLENDNIFQDPKLKKNIISAASRKITMKKREKLIAQNWMVIKPTKFNKFKKSGLQKDIPLRLSYYSLAYFNFSLCESYLDEYKDDDLQDYRYMHQFLNSTPDLKPYIFLRNENEEK